MRPKHKRLNKRRLKNHYQPEANASHSTSAVVIMSPPTEPETRLVPFDENLLERSRTQWQFGDWESLVLLSRDNLQHHPDRAKLALLAAAGHLQSGDAPEARQFVRLAQDWGCSKKLISQILVAGVHNSLGRAAAVSGQEQKAIKHFENAIATGTPGSDVLLVAQARYNFQLSDIHIQNHISSEAPQQNYISNSNHNKTSILRLMSASRFNCKSVLANTESYYFNQIEINDIASRLINEDITIREFALIDAAICMQNAAKESARKELSFTEFTYQMKPFTFIHVTGDYIPMKIARNNKFYELEFLQTLECFQRPGGLIIDCGANIGNHSVYFASIMNAEVFAFEPEPHNAVCLNINAKLNTIEKLLHVFEYALGESDDTVELSMSIDNNYGSFTAKSNANPNRASFSESERVNVPCKTLDSLVPEVSDKIVSIIKIDVEGMELEVIKGGGQIISEHLPLLAIECFNLAQYSQINNHLSGLGYYVIEVTNATPTFIFLNRKNPYHSRRLETYLENKAQSVAAIANGYYSK